MYHGCIDVILGLEQSSKLGFDSDRQLEKILQRSIEGALGGRMKPMRPSARIALY
jgi:hypothetical protein